MTTYFKQSTASQEILLGPFVDDTDGKTAETGLTIANTDIKIWKAGATTLASKNSGGATHISNGNYYAVLDATDTDTLGSMVIVVQVSGALAFRCECMVLAANIYDSMIGASDKLQVDVEQFGDSNLTAASGVPEVKVASIAANAITATAINADAITNAKIADDAIAVENIKDAAITAAKIATGAIDADALATDAAQEIADALLDRSAGVETGLTLRQWLRLAASALFGKVSGAGGATTRFRDFGDTKDRLVATVDTDGNRTAITRDAT